MGGMTGLLLLLWAGVTVGSVVDLQKRIVGGHPCGPTESLYHVALKLTMGTRPSPPCSGSLIYNEWILTAAHCWEKGETIKAVFRNHKEVTISNKNIFKHEANDDIMLLKIPNPTHKITPVLLPVDCKNKPKKPDEVQISGYYSSAKPGEDNDPKLVDTTKPIQCAKTKVDNCDAVSKCVKNTYKYPLENLFCYKDDEVDISDGDSGGGVVDKGIIYGVNVISKKKACGGPAKAMDVCSYMKWISDTIAANQNG